MKKIAILVANKSEDMEVVVPADIWNRAGIITKLISIHNKKNVILAHGTKVSCEAILATENLSKYNAIYLPGGKGCDSFNAEITPKLIKFLQTNALNKKITFLGICASPKVYGKLGMLKGVKATCYPGFEDSFKSSYVKQPVVVSDGFITANGPGSVIDFALKVVEIFIDPNKSKEIASYLLYK